MRLGVISDTHRHIVNLTKALEYLKTQGAKMFIHLGDDYADIEETAERDFLRVPGVFSEVYTDARTPNRVIKNVVGWHLLLTHTVASHPNDLPGDAKPEDLIRDRKVDVVLYGHTHLPEIRQEKGIIFINPGHLKNEDKRGSPASFAFLELTMNRMLARIHRLADYEVIMENAFRR
ncbi:MAG: YfcE family phosphodiesterase [candidate division WOR-3 bacterium]|nr:MAG: YfcE family phosphodiesterase [candidate division WOR-3 bacterium]